MLVLPAAASLERMLPHTEVIRLELVGTGVSGFKSSALHAICRANSIRAVARDDPTLTLLDWDAMRVDDAVMNELAQALETNTTLRQLRIGRNRHLTDEGIDALDTALGRVGCNVTEVVVGDSTGVSAAKVLSLGQSIDVRRLRANDPDMTELLWNGRESSDVEGVRTRRLNSFFKADGADALLHEAAHGRLSEQMLINRRTCKRLADALTDGRNTCLRVIDLGTNPQLNDGGAKYILNALPQSGVVRVFASQTKISEEMQGKIDRACVENALRRLGEDDVSLFALHWFGLELMDGELRQLTDAVLLNTTLQTLELQRHDGLTPLAVKELEGSLQGSAVRGKPNKVVCHWRGQDGESCDLRWWRELGERSANQQGYLDLLPRPPPMPGSPSSPVTFAE